MKLENTVLFVGAGFSKASDIKTTYEVGQKFLNFSSDDNTLEELQTWITNCLNAYYKEIYGWEDGLQLPSLEDHFTILDLTANSGHNLKRYSPKMLRAIRRLSIHRVFDIIDSTFDSKLYVNEFIKRFSRINISNAIITTNWDTALEHYFDKKIDESDKPVLYNYAVDSFYLRKQNRKRVMNRGTAICKLHGSANWNYCDSCRRLFEGERVFRNEVQHPKSTLDNLTFIKKDDLEVLGAPISLVDRFEWDNPLRCRYCGNIELSARVATFSYRKDMDYYQFHAVWEKSLKVLREAKKWLFIGYGLPESDYEIRHLLKTAEMADFKQNRGYKKIIAVNPDSSACDRYKKFFGNRVDTIEEEFNLQSKAQIENLIYT